MSDDFRQISRAVIARRSELGLSRQEAAERCGVSKSAIARIESGQSGISLNTALSICSGLGLRLFAVPVLNEDEA